MLLLAAMLLAPQTPPVRVERSRDTILVAGNSVSTSLDTNGSGGRQTPIDAERAFAADAKTIGQWTAFRKWSTDDAVTFEPQPINAHAWLKYRKDPLKVVDWWPTASYISCDGSLAVNTGGWRHPDGNVGYFSTVWQRQSDGSWKWIVDSGAELKRPRAKVGKVALQRAPCPQTLALFGMKIDAPQAKSAYGYSHDGSLSWSWVVEADGSRIFSAMITGVGRTGTKTRTVIDDRIPATK